MSKVKEDVNQFVLFTLSGETYGVPINKVREIITLQAITRLPGISEFVEGIINLRGHVIPVYNIKKKFNMLNRNQQSSNRIVVVEVQGDVLGIIVDAVTEVLRIPAGTIEKPSPVVSAGIDNNYIEGIAKIDEKLVLIIALEKVVDVKSLSKVI